MPKFDFDDSLDDEILKKSEEIKPPEKPVKGSKPKPQPKQKRETDGNVAYVEEETKAEEDSYVAFAMQKARDEMFVIRKRFDALINALDQSALGSHMRPGSDTFAAFLDKFEELLFKPIRMDKMGSDSADKYDALRNMKAQILSDLFNKYSAEYQEPEED